MENRKRDDKKQSTQKEIYESPKATFVELKLEERLLVCNKAFSYCGMDVQWS